MRRSGIYAVALFFSWILAFPTLAQTITAKVVGVSDGDTISVLQDNQQIKVRLNGIDAPESSQDFGQRSKQALSTMVFGKTVTVLISDTDRYGRKIGEITSDGVNVNQRMVELGMAWHYVEYSKSAALAAAEKTAREGKVGLWADANPTPPWEFRKDKKELKADAVPTTLKPTASVKEAPTASQAVGTAYWLNTSSGVRHNKGCKSFGTTKAGRYCGAGEGKACGQCGG